MDTGEFRASISQIQNNLTNSRKKLHDKAENLNSSLKELQKCIAAKDKEISTLQMQKNDLISLLDQAFAVIDDPSQEKLLEDLTKIESEMKTIVNLGNSGDQKNNAHKYTDVLPIDGSPSIKPNLTEKQDSEPGESAKKWVKEMRN